MPEQFIDDFDLRLKRGSQSTLEGWVHVEGVLSEAEVIVRIPELKVNETAKVGADGGAKFHFEVSDLELWSPEHPRLYRVNLQTGRDHLEDEMGFRAMRRILLDERHLDLKWPIGIVAAQLRSEAKNSRLYAKAGTRSRIRRHNG